MTILEKLAYRHSSFSECYSDFLDWAIGCFLVEGDKPCAERLQNKYKDDYKYFNLMFVDLIGIYNKTIQACIPEEDPNLMRTSTGWCDPLGAIYEEINSKQKASGLGQFFTPEHICNLMSAITICDDTGPGKLIGEPCAGSGRMILAANSYCLGNYYSAVDKDPMCAKMTAINMCIHGVMGQVNCGNSLYIQEEWYFGYEVNSHLQWSGIPTLIPLKKEESFEVKMFTRMMAQKNVVKEIEKPKPLKVIPDITNIPNYVERTLF